MISSKISTRFRSPWRIPDKLIDSFGCYFQSSLAYIPENLDKVRSERRFRIFFIAAVYCRKFIRKLLGSSLRYWSWFSPEFVQIFKKKNQHKKRFLTYAKIFWKTSLRHFCIFISKKCSPELFQKVSQKYIFLSVCVKKADPLFFLTMRSRKKFGKCAFIAAFLPFHCIGQQVDLL